jgi:LemA protein
MSSPLKTVVVATLLGVCVLGAVGAGYHHLARADAREASTAAWLEVAQIHAGRSQAAAAALAAVGSTAGLNPAVTGRAREALARAATLPPRQELLEDAPAIERYKQYQGELTGTLFQLVVGAQRIPALAGSSAVLGLRNELLRDESALASARERYRQAAASYNALSGAFPGASVVAALAYPDLPAGL